MKRRNLIASLLAGIGVLFTGFARVTAAPGGSAPDASDSAAQPATGTQPHATVRVLYADTVKSSWQAVTDGGILVTGATRVVPGHAALANTNIINDAVKAIIAAGGPMLTSGQVALFGGQS